MDSINFTSILAKDNYIYLGRDAPKEIRKQYSAHLLLSHDDCMIRVKEYLRQKPSGYPRDIRCWKKRMSRIDELYKSGTSVILSDESYSYRLLNEKICVDPYYFKTIRKTYQDWNLLIVPTYRRYSEWVVSVVKETNNKGCLAAGHEYAAWEFNGGRTCRAVAPYVNVYVTQPNAAASIYYNLDVTVPEWGGNGMTVKVLNMHSSKHITSSFYCDIVPNAPNTCQYSLNQNEPSELNKRTVLSVAYNDIVSAGANKGLINPYKQTRVEATNKFEKFCHQLQVQYIDFPLSCPSKRRLETFLQKSLLYERLIMPSPSYYYHYDENSNQQNKFDTNNNNIIVTADIDKNKKTASIANIAHTRNSMEQEHRRLFWKMSREGKVFCKVDVDTLFQNITSWRQLLKSIKATVKSREARERKKTRNSNYSTTTATTTVNEK